LVPPAGERFAWGLIGLVKRARPNHKVDLVHRLDRETSGVLVMTKDREANAFLKKHFVERKVRKVYRAIARGVIPWEEQRVDAPIGKAEHSEIGLRRCVRPDGQSAQTTVTVLQRLSGFTLVQCRLHTGRTHQIRVHMEHVGFPLLGDKIYGQPDETFIRWLDIEKPDDALRAQVGFSRHALHAYSVTIPDPTTLQHRTITAPLPEALQAIVDGEEPVWLGEE